MSAPPTLFRYEGEGVMQALRPIAADRVYVVGQKYTLEEVYERSAATHAHQFAWLAEAWAQLPESIADQYPTPEFLRKAALIDAGYYVETILDAGTNAAALRAAAMMRSDDEYARVVVRGPLVVRRVAKTQRKQGMTPKDFQDSKSKVMEIVAALIGVAPDALQQNTGRAA